MSYFIKLGTILSTKKKASLETCLLIPDVLGDIVVTYCSGEIQTVYLCSDDFIFFAAARHSKHIPCLHYNTPWIELCLAIHFFYLLVLAYYWNHFRRSAHKRTLS